MQAGTHKNPPKLRTKWKELAAAACHRPYDAVVVHTYCPANSVIPLRGALASVIGGAMARQSRCPLVLAVGFTVKGESRMESEIYRDFIGEGLGYEGEFLLGTDPNARDTLAETREAYRLCVERGARRVLVIASKPHLRFRVRRFWASTNAANVQLHFLGVPGPFRHTVWEWAMVIINLAVPPGSKRRYWIFDLVGRRR